MSTKIYEARRFAVRHLDAFLTISKQRMFSNVLKRVKDLMEALKLEVVAAEIEETKKNKLSEEFANASVRFDKIMHYCRVASEHPQRDAFFGIDCGWSTRICRRMVYAIPFGESWTRAGILYPEWAEDFAYWNNTDQPEGWSWRRWSARGRVWDKIFNVTHPLVFHAVNLGPGEYASEGELMMEIVSKIRAKELEAAKA